MSKKTQIDKAIDALDEDILVLEAAKARLVQQKVKTPVRKPRRIALAPKD